MSGAAQAARQKSAPPAAVKDFNEKMVRFHTSKEATEMTLFLTECQPENAPEPAPPPKKPAAGSASFSP